MRTITTHRLIFRTFRGISSLTHLAFKKEVAHFLQPKVDMSLDPGATRVGGDANSKLGGSKRWPFLL